MKLRCIACGVELEIEDATVITGRFSGMKIIPVPEHYSQGRLCVRSGLFHAEGWTVGRAYPIPLPVEPLIGCEGN